MSVPGLRTRKPTGRVPWPCILLEGEEKAGKSWALAQFSASDRIGTLYWIDLDEGAADEYGAIPGTRYEVVEHDGSYAAVLAAIQAVKAEARRAATAGEPPVVLGIDTGSTIWDGLKDWASERAAKSSKNRELLKRDPNAEVTISQNLWNDAGSRWRKVQTELLTFPGIVVVTARGKEVTDVDSNGRPIEGQKKWSVQTHREFPYSASVWVRLRRGHRPLIVGARSVHVGIKPGEDAARDVTAPEAEGRLLEWLVFDALKCDPGTAHTRDLQSFHGGALLEHEQAAAEEEGAAGGQVGTVVQRAAAAAQGQRRPQRPEVDWDAEIVGATTSDRLRELWAAARSAGELTDVRAKAIEGRAREIAADEAAAAAGNAQDTPDTPATPDSTNTPDAPDAPAAPAVPDTSAPASPAADTEAWLSELDLIAEIMGKRVPELTQRHIGDKRPVALPAAELAALVVKLRGVAIVKLGGRGGNPAAAKVYKAAPDGAPVTREQLLNPGT